MKKLKKNQGITLIALVVTIIVLLILAVVSFKIISGDDGIMAKATSSAEKHRISAARELLDMKMSEIVANSYEKDLRAPSFEKVVEEFENSEEFEITGIRPREASLKNDVDVSDLSNVEAILVCSKKYEDIIFKIDSDLKIELERVEGGSSASGEESTTDPEPELDITAPIINIDSTTASSISFTITDESGVAAYGITQTNSVSGIEWIEISPVQTNFVTSVSEKTANTTYYIWAKDTEGNTTSSGEEATTVAFPNIQTGDVTWTSSWSGSKATLTLTNNTQDQVAVSKNGTNFEQLVGNSVSVESGETIYIKITDGTNSSTNYLSETILRTGTVTYNANQGRGEVPSSETAEHTTEVQIKTDKTPIRNGYIFQGWNTSSTATTVIDGSFTMPAEDVVLYAVWRQATTQVENSEHPEWHIPTGFAHTIGTASDGYVISDGTNEFVWIPVPDTARYTKQLGTNNYYLKANNAAASSIADGIRGDTLGVSKILDTNVTSTLSESSPESAVVYAAGGFWVGRYEAGIESVARSGTIDETYWNTSRTIVVKQGAEPVRQIYQNKALEIANNWKSGNADEVAGTVKFQSGLITGAQWDAMCKFIDWNTCNTDCSSWGNYYNVASGSYSGIRSQSNDTTWKSGLGQKKASTYSIFPTGIFTGSSVQSTAKKNIYDVAGNVWEWTTEIPQYTASNAVLRGGSANNNGSDVFATGRDRRWFIRALC